MPGAPALERVLSALESAAGARAGMYRIPGLWVDRDEVEVPVHPHPFLSERIRSGILSRADPRRAYGRSLSAMLEPRGSGGSWVGEAVAYSSLVRTTTAWAHDGAGAIRAGTFLKTIALLPWIRRMGVDLLYLLPVTRRSERYRKGTLGSPYAVRDPLALDPLLQDPLLAAAGLDIETEFRALVEACHVLGIRVAIDFAPRTAARDSAMLAAHPDWFYWIDRTFEERFGPPRIDKMKFQQPSPRNLGRVYRDRSTRALLAAYRPAPSESDPARWESLLAEAGERDDLLDRIEASFGVTVSPAFSDWINDDQPAWKDITFWRLFLDHPAVARPHIRPDQPPYVMHDVAKASIFPGERPNLPLWDWIAGTLPSWQERFGIDGARIDMAHALPRELECAIQDRARAIDPDFGFISEELNPGNQREVAEKGYGVFLGNAWWSLPRHRDGKARALVEKLIPKLVVPMIASPETPDTPRAAARPGGIEFARFAMTACAALPATVPLINSGFELGERQPMNLGLDSPELERFRLEKDDPQFGKLAFFDLYALHWDDPGAAKMARFVEDLMASRRELLEWAGRGKPVVVRTPSDAPDVFGIAQRAGARGFGVIANGGDAERRIAFRPIGFASWKPEIGPVFSSLWERHPLPAIWREGGWWEVLLGPMEALILRYEGRPHPSR
ncbi:MAG: alpha-amylase [Planctomycetes bacterium]|nr:alpha-amylase [Planctomycetota bacterium]